MKFDCAVKGECCQAGYWVEESCFDWKEFAKVLTAFVLLNFVSGWFFQTWHTKLLLLICFLICGLYCGIMLGLNSNKKTKFVWKRRG
jgi:hypothetical protein